MKNIGLYCILIFVSGCSNASYIETIVYDSVDGPNTAYECEDLEYFGYRVHGPENITQGSFKMLRIGSSTGRMQINTKPLSESTENDCPIVTVNGNEFKHTKYSSILGACNYDFHNLVLSELPLRILLSNEYRSCNVDLGEYRYKLISSEIASK
jgi:hypothetical protein